MSKALETAVRQYRHNNSDGLLIAYEAEETNKIVASMESLISKQQLEIEELKGRILIHKEMFSEARSHLWRPEQWSMKCPDFPKVAMRGIIGARQSLED